MFTYWIRYKLFSPIPCSRASPLVVAGTSRCHISGSCDFTTGGLSYWFDVTLRFPVDLWWFSYHWTTLWRFNITIKVLQSFFWWYFSLNSFLCCCLVCFEPDNCLIFDAAGSNFLSVAWLGASVCCMLRCYFSIFSTLTIGTSFTTFVEEALSWVSKYFFIGLRILSIC